MTNKVDIEEWHDLDSRTTSEIRLCHAKITRKCVWNITDYGALEKD